MFKRKKKDEILSDHDAVQILDTIDKIIAVDNMIDITFFFKLFSISISSSYYKFIDLSFRGYRLIFYDTGKNEC